MPEDTQVFTTTLWSSDPKGTKVGIVVPEDVVAALGRGRRPPVVVTVDGDYSFRGTVAVMSGQFLISFNAETRAATG